MWHTSHTFGSLQSKLTHISHVWLFGIKMWHTSHTFGSLESKFGTPLTLSALWNQKMAPLSHFWLFGVRSWHPSHTFGSLLKSQKFLLEISNNLPMHERHGGGILRQQLDTTAQGAPMVDELRAPL